MERIKELRRTHYCSEISDSTVGQSVVLMGWIQRRRDHGGVIFLDLRDRSSIVQLVLSSDIDVVSFEKGQALRSECVIAVQGKVRLRPPGLKTQI